MGDGHSTLFVEPGWQVCVGDAGSLKLALQSSALTKVEDRPAEVEIELFTQRFRHLVQVMGDQLKRTAISTNVKERQDYSCWGVRLFEHAKSPGAGLETGSHPRPVLSNLL